MTVGHLLLRNLFFHWRGNSAVFLGVAVGAAVLTGALLVGDSLRGSLRDLTLERLGWVDQAMVSGRFVRDALAAELQADHVAPAILLQGAATVQPDGADASSHAVHHAGRITILGVDDRFWSGSRVPVNNAFWQSAESEVVLNAALARALDAAVGSTVILHLQKASAIPREILLGRRESSAVVDSLQLTVREIVPEGGLGQFTLNPTPSMPRNAFVPLRLLQTKLDLAGRVNALLVHSGRSAGDLKEELQKSLTLDDWGLVVQDPRRRTETLFAKLDRNHDGKLKPNESRGRVAGVFAKAADADGDGILTREEIERFYQHRGYFTLESKQFLLEAAVAEAAMKVAGESGLRPAPTLVYLANTISDEDWPGASEVPYSVVAALDPALPSPLGPFLPPGVEKLKDDEIILAGFPESPLQIGDRIALSYFPPEQQDQLKEEHATFKHRGLLAMKGVAADPDLTPEFPGITDKLDIRNWDPPFPYDNSRVKQTDEDYWKEYRTTPKAYVTLAAGQKLWGSRFGQLTSIRLAPASGGNLNEAAAKFAAGLLAQLRPEQGGLVFDDVRQRSLAASAGSTDFTWLFVGFSSFLIAAALLLVGLLYRLNIDRRASEIGVLLATGYRRRTVRRLLLGEGALLATGGGLLGLAGAVAYGWLLLRFFQHLTSQWPGANEHSFLRLHVTGQSLIFGYLGALAVSVLTIAWAVRVLGRLSPRALLAGETTAESAPGSANHPPRRSPWIAGVAAVLGLALVVCGGFVHDHEMQASSFLGGGVLLLTASLSAVWAWMHGNRMGHVAGDGGVALARLGIRNAARHPARSLLTAGLLACSAFLIVAVESFRREPDRDYLQRDSGSGGFALLAESDLPVYQNLNSAKGREEILASLERQWEKQTGTDGNRRSVELQKAEYVLKDATFYPFRVRAGDDASCLNLYQPRRPRLLGVPQALIERGGFRLAEAATQTKDQQNPWLLLDKSDGPVPVFGEKNTVEWILGSKLGGKLKVPNERGEMVEVEIVGLLQDSVFQRELLMSEANFLKLYPNHGGYNVFLIDAPPGEAATVRNLLETALADHGLEVTPTDQALAGYLAVENTYLSTFQALGGLGLLLGALGLAVVLLRTIGKRRGELALLRAVGYRKRSLGWLVLAENGFLLILGLLVGAVAALLAVSPQLAAGAGEIPVARLLEFLAVVAVVGTLAGLAAVVSALRAPLLPALRRE